MSKRTYSTDGNVRGDCGHAHKTIYAAYLCAQRDGDGCQRQGGYSDRTRLVVRQGQLEVEPTPDEFDEWENGCPEQYHADRDAR